MLNQFRLNTITPPPLQKFTIFFKKWDFQYCEEEKSLHHHTSVKIFFINFGIYKLSKTRGENIFFGGKSLQSIKNYDDSDTFIGLFRLDLAPSLFNPWGGGIGEITPFTTTRQKCANLLSSRIVIKTRYPPIFKDVCSTRICGGKEFLHSEKSKSCVNQFVKNPVVRKFVKYWHSVDLFI